MRRGTNPKKPGPINPTFRLPLKRSGRASFAVLAEFAGGFAPIVTISCLIAAALWAWHFTVDDALISVRYARNWSRGLGWCFNPGQPATDGVTPLPWPVLLAPFARFYAGFALLFVAKAIGALGVLGSAAVIAWNMARTQAPRASLLLVAVPFPLTAWAVSGMETGIATLLATLAVACESGLGAVCAGLAATFRPELLPWALVLVGVRSWSRPTSVRHKVCMLLLAAAPWAFVAGVRLVAFGRAAPLAVLAKPSDLHHGAGYVLAATLACGTPLLLLGAWRREARAVGWAALMHLAVVAALGGDWMPYARLLVPILPSLALVPAWGPLRTRLLGAAALASALLVGWRAAPRGIHVGLDRERVVARLAGLPVPVAALDVGFVALAAGDGVVIDMGGLTDGEIAVLPGGQTSKHVDLGMLEARGVRSVVTWGEQGSRVVEQRIVYDARFKPHFEGRAVDVLGERAVWLWVRR